MQVEIWLALEDIDEIAGDLKKKRDNAKDPDHKELLDEKARIKYMAAAPALGGLGSRARDASKLDESRIETANLHDSA